MRISFRIRSVDRIANKVYIWLRRGTCEVSTVVTMRKACSLRRWFKNWNASGVLGRNARHGLEQFFYNGGSVCF